MKGMVLGILCLLGTGCVSRSNLEEALCAAGNNRVQLEQVLKHYSKVPEDSLKYKAACFLIRNMPGHGWYDGCELDGYKRWVDSIYADKDFIFRMVLYDAYLRQPGALEGLEWHEDVATLDSVFLIAHIDSVFSGVKRRPWLKEFTFEQLCEYVLPYRVGYERPVRLWELQDSLFREVQGWLEYDDVCHNGSDLFKRIYPDDYLSEYEVRLLYHGHSVRYSLLGCIPLALARAWRAKLSFCPIGLDLMPASPKKNGRHCWVAVLDGREATGSIPLSIEGRKQGKIYRTVFSRQLVPGMDSVEFVPPFFRNPFLKDVTVLYTSVKDVAVCPFCPIHTAYAYLCVFNDLH